MGYLRKQQRNHMAPGSEPATLSVNAETVRETRTRVGWNDVAHLMKRGDTVLDPFRIFHLGGILWSESPADHLFLLHYRFSCGTPVF